MTKEKKEKMFPAIPPNDYQGTIAKWIVGLQQRGLLKEDQFYGDIMIPESVYDEILEECEK